MRRNTRLVESLVLILSIISFSFAPNFHEEAEAVGFYEKNLVTFVILISAFGYYQWRRDVVSTEARDLGAESDTRAVNWQFKKRFLPVYLLVCLLPLLFWHIL